MELIYLLFVVGPGPLQPAHHYALVSLQPAHQPALVSFSMHCQIVAVDFQELGQSLLRQGPLNLASLHSIANTPWLGTCTVQPARDKIAAL